MQITTKEVKSKTGLKVSTEDILEWKKFLVKNLGVDIIKLIWETNPIYYADWTKTLKEKALFVRAGELANLYAKTHRFNEKDIFTLFSDLIAYSTYIGYKREQRALKWLKKAKYKVSKTSKYDDIFKMFDLYAEKDGNKYAVQVKGNTIKGIEQDLYKFILTARKDGLIPMIAIIRPDSIRVSHTKIVQQVIETIEKRKESA